MASRDYSVRGTVRRRIAIVFACLVAVTAGLAACVVVLGQETNQCDNLAGTCLRDRQKLAIYAIQVGAPVATGVAVVGLALASIGRRLTRVLAIAVLLGALFCAGVLAADPLPHLNNSRTGWLAR